MAEQKDGFFVGINNAVDLRRNILESSREIVQNMQSFENVRNIREIKIKRIQQLKTVIRELDLLFAKLRAELPQTHLRAISEENIEVGRKKPKPKTLKEMTAIEKLDTQLREIEQEISRMS
ncbi:MAG: hypothetical protein KKF44_03230 [Nanoarchaeota archaeon]|nr:hypothetical protein [Nanoarchaeota archaeon]